MEVSTDDGKTWKDAEIQGPVHRKAHTRFRYGWNWNGEEVTLRSRSTDETGEVQPTLTEIAELLKVSEEWIKHQAAFSETLMLFKPGKSAAMGASKCVFA